jgi:hypothetical protein
MNCWFGFYATFVSHVEATFRTYESIASCAEQFRTHTTAWAVRRLVTKRKESDDIAFSPRNGSPDDGGRTFDILESDANLDAWWRMTQFVFDESELHIDYRHYIVNCFAVSAVVRSTQNPNTLAVKSPPLTFHRARSQVMVAVLLLMAFGNEERAMSQIEQQVFFMMSTLALGHSTMVFFVLQEVLRVNKHMHFGVLKDLKKIVVHLRLELDGGTTTDRERRERLRWQVSRIESVYERERERQSRVGAKPLACTHQKSNPLTLSLRRYIASMEESPMLVGRLLGARVTPEMVRKGAAALLAATFSAVVKAGLLD